jgi:hypothetical protein
MIATAPVVVLIPSGTSRVPMPHHPRRRRARPAAHQNKRRRGWAHKTPSRDPYAAPQNLHEIPTSPLRPPPERSCRKWRRASSASGANQLRAPGRGGEGSVALAASVPTYAAAVAAAERRCTGTPSDLARRSDRYRVDLAGLGSFALTMRGNA